MIEEGRGYAVFLRAANVGGHQVFKPSRVAQALSEFGAKSIGAAGTFVFDTDANEAKLRAAILKALPFKPEMLLVPGSTVAKLVGSMPFGPSAPAPGEKLFASALIEPPAKKPKLLICAPNPKAWQLKVVAVRGRFALSVRRAKEPGKFYPNEVIEKELGVPATTRAWSTVESVARALRAPAP